MFDLAIEIIRFTAVFALLSGAFAMLTVLTGIFALSDIPRKSIANRRRRR
jgi:hypothetical protein